MRKREVIKNYKRENLFNYYHERTNPFLCINTEIEVTNVINYCKVHKNYYATMAYLLMKAINKVPEFNVRYENGEFIQYTNPFTNFTQMRDDETIGFYRINTTDNYKKFIEDFLNADKKFKQTGETMPCSDQGEVWFSCAPWFKFNSISTPNDKSIQVVQFIWDKFEERNGKYYTNLMIFAHHGFLDGFHMGKLINFIIEEMNNFMVN